MEAHSVHAQNNRKKFRKQSIKIKEVKEEKEQLSEHIRKAKIELSAQVYKMNTKTGPEKKNFLIELWDKLTFNEQFRLRSKLKEDLITYYIENESQIPAAPLVEEHKVALEDLYVLPPMWAYDNPYQFGPGNDTNYEQQTRFNKTSKRQKITINQLFLSDDKNVRYKKIYMTANAGFGKTSLSQKLAMTWCQSHRPLNSLESETKYDDDELSALKYFDYLFLLHLRDYQSEVSQEKPQCKLDDLIKKMLSMYLPDNTKYNEEFIQNILNEKKCLIILDGLDEWSHPARCPRKPEVPHNNHPDSCTVLTTTRDWKMGTIGLSPNQIDRRVEISELDYRTRDLLEKNAIRILNAKGLNLVEKEQADFDKEVVSVKIVYIPYILLQLICLFFGGLPIGKSKCEIYSNIAEFTLKRGLNRKNLPDVLAKSNDTVVVPNCMKENETCNRYISLIMKLGELSFFTLFCEKKELSLIFDEKEVSKYMSQKEKDFCLNVGFLCQIKDNSVLAEKRYKVFFQHKSVQEFFSSIYIISEWNNDTVKLPLLKACSSFVSILEMTNLFVFVCGMNPEVYTCISSELQKIVERDNVTCRYRSELYNPFNSVNYLDDAATMESYQSMQLKCFEEGKRNGYGSCSISLHDILLEDFSLTKVDLNALEKNALFNTGNVKSLRLSILTENIATFVQSLDHCAFSSLETLRVLVFDNELLPIWLADILTKCATTLKVLALYGFSLSDIRKTSLTEMKVLRSFWLGYVSMTHSDIENLYGYISQITTLTQLTLLSIRCSDHKGQVDNCDVTLYLQRLNELKMLRLSRIPCREIRFNPTCLEKLYFEKMTFSASELLLEDLGAAPLLTSLGIGSITSCQMILLNQSLTQLQDQLQYLIFKDIDMGNVIPRFSSAMTKLESVVLKNVTMPPSAWRELFLSFDHLPRSITVKLSEIEMTSCEWRELLLSVGVLTQTVAVELNKCEGALREEWMTIVDEIKSIPTLSISPNLHIGYFTSMVLKNKAVQ